MREEPANGEPKEELASDAPAEPAAAEPVVEAPEAPTQAEAVRDFGPDWQGGQTVDVEVDSSNGTASAVVGVFAGEVVGVGVVKSDGDVVEADSFTAVPLEGAVGVASINVSSAGLTGKTTLRIRLAS